MSSNQPIRLSQLTAVIEKTVKNAFADRSYWIIADITSHTFKNDRNYHHFELVEKDPSGHALLAKVQAKAWGKGAQAIQQFQLQTGQRFTNNISVLVNVSINFHAVYGLQLNLNDIDINFTLGALEQQRLAILAKLVEENPGFIRKVGDQYLTKNKELTLNRVIQRIAVVSSETSAGLQDFRHTLDTNPFGYRFIIDDYFTIVQGEGNAGLFLTRLIDVFTSNKAYDAVVIIRGGGAQTDFLLFDNYMIGKAVAKFPIPVITGIGHQKNETITDLMAHTQTKTPTRAAEFIIDHNHGFEMEVQQFRQLIIIRSQQQLAGRLQMLNQLNQIIVNESSALLFNKQRSLLSISAAIAARPRVLVYNKLNDISQLRANIHTFCAFYWKNQRNNLGHYTSMIRALSPENTLKRGFAIIKVDDKVTSDPDDLIIGKQVQILLSDKEIGAAITSKKDYHGNEFNL